MTLWDWAADAYAKPGAEDACLELQDGYDQNVCYLLWAAWAAGEGRLLDAETLEAGADAARAWDGVATTPLRAIRRDLNKPIPDMDDAAREALREAVKAAELQAERALMADLEALAPQAGGAPRSLEAGLVEAARVWARFTPRVQLQTLAAALSA
jgi:uncharacterized protein (TIGR02444 family)